LIITIKKQPPYIDTANVRNYFLNGGINYTKNATHKSLIYYLLWIHTQNYNTKNKFHYNQHLQASIVDE